MPHLHSRLAKNNPDQALALALVALILTAKGVPFIYFEEEIGMKNHIANKLHEMHDIQEITHYKLAIEEGKTTEEVLNTGNSHNRDKSRSVRQWANYTLPDFQ